MTIPLRVLILEDEPSDAELMVRELRRAGYDPTWKCVATEAGYTAALAEGWDLILADYTLPQFNAIDALHLMQDRGLCLPFIVVTGSVGEEVAVACLHEGAADYLLKQNLTRLGPAVVRALERQHLAAERTRAEKALRESEATLRAVFHSSADLITIADMETGAYIEVNEGFLQATGYTREEVTGKTGGALSLWVQPDQRCQVVQRLSQDQEVRNEETWFRKKDGTLFIGLLTADIIQVSGRPSLLCIVRDITERKRMEEALRQSERLYQTLTECSPVGIFRTDAQGRTTYVNPAWRKITGAESLDPMENGWLKAIHPEDRERIDAGWRQAVGAGNPSTAEYRFVRPNGSVAWVTGHAVPETDAEGRLVGYIGTITDITERKRMEEEAKERHLFLENVLASAPDAIAVLDAQARVVEWNEGATALFGYTRDEALGKHIDDLIARPDPDIHREAIGLTDRLLRGEPIATSEIVRFRKDGTPVTVIAAGAPIVVSGRLVGIVAVYTDITERKQMEEALARRNRDLQILNELSRGLAQTLDLQRIYVTARDYVTQLVDAPMFGISLYDAASRTLHAEFMSSSGDIVDSAQFPPLTMPLDAPKPLRGRARAILTAEPEVIESLPDVFTQTGAKPQVIGPPGDQRAPLSAAYIPVVVEGQVIGLVEVQSYRANAYDKDATEMLRSVAGQIGLAIQNARLFQQVQARAAELERNLAELRQTQEALRASEARFRSLVESMDDIVFTLDREGRHTGVFGRWLTKYGTPPEMYLGKTARELMGPEAARVHEEANARALAGENVVYEWHADRPDGRFYFQTSLSPLFDADGQIIGIVGVGRDITALKQAEEALRESEERYRLLVNLSPDGMWVHRYGEILFANAAAAAMFGADSPESLIGRQALDFVAPEYRDLVRERMRRGQGERVPAPLLEEKLLRVDGTEFWADVCAVPIEWGGEPAVQVIIRDTTERKRLEERLLQAQKMEVVGRLAGGVAHDFNNILTAISGYATFALEALPPSDPVRQDIQQVLDSAQRAANLTQQLLAFSRRQIIERRVINLNDLILNLDKMLRRLIGEDIELIVLPGEDLAQVRADPGQIEQVIVNLAVNARDAMPEGGKLILETANVVLDEDYAQRHPGAKPGDHVMLAITDTGVGMSDEIKAHLFEPFFTTKETGKGTGLGLATAYGIVKQHGGDIYAYSEPGKGTTFKIYLPAVKAEAERLPRRDDKGFIPGGTETVLVVEDEALVRSMIVRTLREQGYRILEAANGNEALRLAEQYEGEIHLLMTDVVMPQMNGKELQDRFVALRPGTKVLFVSGYTDDAIAHRGILDSGVAFLQKPFTAAALARKVRQVLDVDWGAPGHPRRGRTPEA